MDTFVKPFKQASMDLARGVSSFPGNVARGVSKIGDGLTSISDGVVENAGKIFRTSSNSNHNNSSNNNNRYSVQITRDLQSFPIMEEPQVEVSKLLLRREKSN